MFWAASLETLRYPEIGVRVAPCFFHFVVTSSTLPGRTSRFSGVDTSLPVEVLRVAAILHDGETSKFLRLFKYKCKLCDSLAMLLQVCSNIFAKFEF